MSQNLDNIEPLTVSPKVAWRMLGCSHRIGYELINRGDLQSYLEGKSRRIVTASIKRYIERRLAGGLEKWGGAPLNPHMVAAAQESSAA
jgi:hypothetical protein